MDLTESTRFPQNHFPVLEMPAKEGKEGESGDKQEEPKKDAREEQEEAKAAAAPEGASSVLENRPKREPSKSEKGATIMSDAMNVQLD